MFPLYKKAYFYVIYVCLCIYYENFSHKYILAYMNEKS
ncbi:MAG: hypothetical protein JWQ30_558 [Sediminibacterium sp.]|nr:hypothetical protein [Sediminibacterium sp.]